MKTAEQLASTLYFLVERNIVPGLLPKDVLAAADMIVAQKAEIKSLTAALATHEHTVTATATEDAFRTNLRIELVAADPRRFFAETQVDSQSIRDINYLPYAAKHMAKVATEEWMREIEGKCFRALNDAVKENAT